MLDGRIRRSNSCTSATPTSFPITSIVSSSYQEQQHSLLGGSSFPASYTPPLGRAVRFDDLDDNDDRDSNNQCGHDCNNNNNNNDASTEDESDHPVVVAKSKNPLRRRSVEHTKNKNSSSNTPELSRAQKAGCFNYIKRRHSIALAFASDTAEPDADSGHGADASSSNWEVAKSKHGVTVFKSKRSRCEVRGVTRVNSSVKNVMSLLAPGESTESFAHAQKILLGDDNVLEASVLAQCVPSSVSRYFHCGLKHMALKNPFGITPIDLVFLDYTDVSTTPDGKLVGYRIMESIRVPEFRAVPKYVRASLRCEVYVVRETDVPGVVDVTFASHLDPKSKYASSKRSHWLDQASARLSNLRSYAEKASFSHKLILEKGKWIQRTTRPRCVVCDASFSFLRKRHNCRLCGEVTCGRCSRKLPILVDTVTTRVRVCLRCILDSRHEPDELGRSQFGTGANRRGSVGNATYIAYDDDVDPVQALLQLDNHKHEHELPCVRNEFVSA